MSYKPLEAHLLKSNIEGHFSLLVQLPDGQVLHAHIFPGLSQSILQKFDVVEAPEGAPEFETAKAVSLILKTT